MNTENRQDSHSISMSEIKEAARQLLQARQDVRVRIHALTMQALTRGEVAEQEIRAVLRAVAEGVSQGAAEHTQEVKAALMDAVNGMDDALTDAADALHATLGETGAHARDFAEQDLKQGLAELEKLELMLLETLGRVSESATGLVKQEFTAVTEAARQAGTRTGTRARMVAEELAAHLRAKAHEARAAGKQVARSVGAKVATVASSKLAEIAARIQNKADALKQGK